MRAGWVIIIIVRCLIGYMLIFAAMMTLAGAAFYFFGPAAMSDVIWGCLGLVIIGQIVTDIVKEWRRRAAVRRMTGKEEW